MSRNLGQTCCKICSDKVVLDEQPRLATENDCGFYLSERRPGFMVANSHCVACDAKYLAWVESDDGTGNQFVDLSFRSTFNDEPGPDDLPTQEVLVRLAIRWKEEAIGRSLQEIREYRTESQRKLLELYEELKSIRAKAADSYWESYRRRYSSVAPTS